MKKESGVTLVELLVAVALLSLLMVAFYTVFKGGTKAYETGEARVELAQNGRIALDRMASEIRRALPDAFSNGAKRTFRILNDSGSAVGAGTAGTQILFYAPIDDVDGAEEIRFSRFTKSGTTPTNILYKRVQNPGASQGDQEITTECVTSLTFSEKPPLGAVESGFITINLELKDLEDAANPVTITLTTKVKAPCHYGQGLTGA